MHWAQWSPPKNVVRCAMQRSSVLTAMGEYIRRELHQLVTALCSDDAESVKPAEQHHRASGSNCARGDDEQSRCQICLRLLTVSADTVVDCRCCYRPVTTWDVEMAVARVGGVLIDGYALEVLTQVMRGGTG